MKHRKHLVCAQCGEPLEIVEDIVEKMGELGIDMGEADSALRRYMAFRCDGCGRQNLIPLGPVK